MCWDDAPPYDDLTPPTPTRPRTYVLSGGTPPAHGRLVLQSPWARAGIAPGDRPVIEATIPAGYTIAVLVTGNRAFWSMRCTGPSGYSGGPLKVSHGVPLASAIEWAIGHWGLRGERVTTDGAGNVVEWEPAS